MSQTNDLVFFLIARESSLGNRLKSSVSVRGPRSHEDEEPPLHLRAFLGVIIHYMLLYTFACLIFC